MVAGFLLDVDRVRQELESGAADGYTLEQWQEQNQRLYSDILPEHYGESYGNPAYAVKVLGEVHGRILSFLYEQLRGMIPYVFELQDNPDMLECIVVHLETFH